MSSEAKWAVACIMALFLLPMFGMAYDSYLDSQCRIIAIQSGVPVDNIEKACGGK